MVALDWYISHAWTQGFKYQLSWRPLTLGVAYHVDSVRGVRHDWLDLGPHSLHLVVHAVIDAVLKTELRALARESAKKIVLKYARKLKRTKSQIYRLKLGSRRKKTTTYQVVECIHVDDSGARMSLRDGVRQVAQVSWPAEDAVHEHDGAVAIGGSICEIRMRQRLVAEGVVRLRPSYIA